MVSFLQPGKISRLFSELLQSKNKACTPETEQQAYKFVVSYMLFSSPSGVRRSLLVEVGSEAAKRMKRDYAKIEKLARQLSDLLELTAAGDSISHYDEVEMLGGLAASASLKKEEFTPDRGRNKSEERKYRLFMVKNFAELAELQGIKAGSGSTGLFPNFIHEVYDILSITQFNLSQDIQDSRKT